MEKIYGIAKAEVKFKPVVKCNYCSATAFSDQISLQIGAVPISDLCSEIEREMRTKLFQPPVGWSINGRGNYKCDVCMSGESE